MDSATTFSRRKKSGGGVASPAPVGPFFAAPSSYPAQAGVYPPRQESGEMGRTAYNQQRGFFPPTTQPRQNNAARRPQSQQAPRMPALTFGQPRNDGDFQGYYPGQPPKTAGTRPYRLPPDVAHGRSSSGGRYPSPPSTAPPGSRHPHNLPPYTHSPSPPQQTMGVADDAARARATLLDRERRQIFAFLSSPNCFLFSGVSGPVGLTEEDLDLLLAAGNTSTWTLMHLRALDANGHRYNSFDELIPAVASRAASQADENRRVLAWLTGPQCSLFVGGDDGSGGVLLSMADVERLVLESGVGPSETLRQLQQLQNSPHQQQFDSFQSLIRALRDAEIGAKQHTGPAQSSGRHQKGPSQQLVHAPSAQPQNNAPQNSSSATGPFSPVDDEERRLVLSYASSAEGAALFSHADSIVATAADLDALINWAGNAALAIEGLMQLNQHRAVVHQFSDLLPALQRLKAGGVTPPAARPLLTQAEIESNRALVHAYLAGQSLLFSERDSPVQATGGDFDNLVEAAGGNAHDCVAILKNLDAHTDDSESASGDVTPAQRGMKFQSFPELIQAVATTHAANLAAARMAISWTPELREAVLQFLASPSGGRLFADLAAGDVEVHLSQLDTLMDIGGAHTLTWLTWMARALPPTRFDSFAALTAAVRERVADMKAHVAPKVLSMLSKPTCPLFHAQPSSAKPKASKVRGKKSKSAALAAHAGYGPGSGVLIATKITLRDVEDLMYASEACIDTPVHLDSLIREGRSFSSLSHLVEAVREAHEDRRNLAFVTDTDRAAIVDFLSKENCVLFAEADAAQPAASLYLGSSSAAAQLAASHPGAPNFDEAAAGTPTASHQDIKVKKQDLDRLIVQGKGVNMCLFHLSALNASGRQFSHFAELLPAVREAHQQSVIEKADLLAKLISHRAALFLPTAYQHHSDSKDLHADNAVGELTASHADSLYIDGAAGGQTAQYIDIFLETGLSFSSFFELVQAVSDLHASVLRNRYAAHLMERSERGMSSQERRDVILAYLYSSSTTLFSDAEDVHVSDEDLDLLQLEAAGLGSAAAAALASGSHTPLALAHTLLFLRYIDMSGRKFQGFASFRASVRDCFLASVRQKKAILEYLRGTSSTPTNEPPCRLLASATQLQRTLDARDVERLFVQGQAGPTTMSFLLELEDSGFQATTLDVLINGVRLAHTQARDTRAVEKNVLLSYLGSGSCTLMAGSGIGGAGHSAVVAPLRPVSDMELHSLLNVGKGGVSTLFFLQLLESTGRSFTSVAELIAAVKDAREGHAAARKKEIAHFLKGERCHLLRDLERTPVNQACVDRLYVESGAGACTLLHLWALNVAGNSYASIDSLIASVKQSLESSFTRAASERLMVLVHLLGPCSGGVFPHLHGLAPVFWLRTSTDDLDALISLCESAANATRFLVSLSRAHKTCDSWAALMDLLHAQYEELVSGRQQLLAKLSNGDECTLFNTSTQPPGHSSVDVNSLTLRDMDALTMRTQDARKTLFLLEAFEQRQSKFASFSDLANAVGLAHYNTMASIRAEKSLIYLHLTAPACTLMAPAVAAAAASSAPFQLLDVELDALFLVSGSAKGTLFFLNQLEAHNKSYASMHALIDDVTALHTESVSVKAEARAFFAHPAHKLLQHSAHAHGGVTAADVDRLYTESQAGIELMPLLWAIETQGSRFVSMAQVIAAVRSAALRSTQQAKDDRMLILNFLSGCHLFRGPVAAKPADIDQLIQAGGGPLPNNPASAAPQPASATLELLKELDAKAMTAAAAQHDQGETGVESFAALISNVSSLRAENLAMRAAVHTFLHAPRGGAHLFIDAPSEVLVDAAAVDRLFVRGGAGKYTLDHVRALAVAGGRFGSFFSFDELIQSVRSLHLSAMGKERERESAKKDAVEEEKQQPVPILTPPPRVLDQARGSSDRAPPPVEAPAPPAPIAAGSPAAVLAFLQSPLRRFFRRSHEVVSIGERELDSLLAVSESAASLLAHLQELEEGASACFASFNQLLEQVQAAEHKALVERKAISAFLASNKCRLLHASAISEQKEPLQVTDAQVSELLAVGSAGSFTLLHLQRLNDDHAHAAHGATDTAQLGRFVREAQAASAETVRAQKQMVRTYLASFHSELLWSAPHGNHSAQAATRHRLTDSELNTLLLEAGGSGSSLLSHLHQLDDTRISSAAHAAPGSAPRRAYHSFVDLAHAVRSLSQHELHAKRDLLEHLNSSSCSLWSTSVPQHGHVSISDIDRLVDGTQAHFDTPLLLWLFAHAGRRFDSAAALIAAVRDARTECATGANAEALTLVAHFASPLCTLLPSSTDAPFRATLVDLGRLLQAGGGGSSTLFELCQLEVASFVARDFDDLIRAVTDGAKGPTAQTKAAALDYLSESARVFTADASRLEALYATPSSSPAAATDSLVQLPATSAGVTRMVEESGCGTGLLRALQLLDRSHIALPDLRAAVDELLDTHPTAERHEEVIAHRRAQIAADKVLALATAEAAAAEPIAPVEVVPASRWTDADRQSLVDWLSSPDTLIFSESAAHLEVSARLLDALLEAAPGFDVDVAAPPSAQATLVLLRHLNAGARKMGDIAELTAALTKEHALLVQVATETHARLTSPQCTLWTTNVAPTLSVSDVGHMLLDTHVATQASLRLDELEFAQQTFSTVSQLSAALSDEQASVFSRLAAAKESLIAHLSLAEVSNHLFSQAVNMTDVDLHAILVAGRFGGKNCTDAIDAARTQQLKFESVSALLASVRAHTATIEQELLSYLHTPAGSGLLAHPEHVLPYLSGHLLSCMSFIYGSVDAGSETMARAKQLSQAQVVCGNVHQLVATLREPVQSIRARDTKRSSAEQADLLLASEESPAPTEDDVSSLVAFLQHPSTLLFADSPMDLSVETDHIVALFAAAASVTNGSGHGDWAVAEVELLKLNEVHRRFTHFTELAPAILLAKQEGAYSSEEQHNAIRSAIHASELLFAAAGGPAPADESLAEEDRLVRDSAGQVIVSRDRAERLLRTVLVNPDAQESGFVELLAHLAALGFVARQFRDWVALQSALQVTVARPEHGHISEGEFAALMVFFSSPEEVMLPTGPDSVTEKPTAAQLDELVSTAGSFAAAMELLTHLNERKFRAPTVRILLDEIAALRKAPPADAVPAAVIAPVEPATPSSVVQPEIPHISGEDQQRLANYLGQCQLFAEATSSLEVSVEALDSLSFECGSVPDLLDLLKTLDAAGERFSSFNDLVSRVSEKVRLQSQAPLGEEPKPVERKPSVVGLPPVVPAAAPVQTLEPTPEVVAENAPASETGSVSAEPATAPAQSIAEPAAELTSVVAPATESAAIEPTPIAQPTPSSNAAVEPAAGSSSPVVEAAPAASTPAVEAVAAPAIAPSSGDSAAASGPTEAIPSTTSAAPTAAAPQAPAVEPLTDDERNAVVAVLSESNLFSEATESLELDPSDLDIMRADAGSVDALIAALHELDARGERPHNFPSLFATCKAHWAAKKNAPAAEAAPAPAATGVVIGPNDAQTLVEFLGTAMLFSEAASELSAEADAIDQLIVSAGGIDSLLHALRRMDEVHRRFESVDQLQPAVIEARDAGFIGGAASSTLIAYLSEQCNLFSHAADLEVTVDALDSLVAAGQGLNNTIAALRLMDSEGVKVGAFGELAPLLMARLQAAAAAAAPAPTA